MITSEPVYYIRKMRELLLVFCFLGAIFYCEAQYCGVSGSQVCSPVVLSDSIVFNQYAYPCVKKGIYYNESISMVVKDYTFQLGGQILTFYLDTICVDSFSRLPAGLCWSTNKSNNKGYTGDTICINVQGITDTSIATYTAYLSIRSYYQPQLPIIPEIEPAAYFFRVIDKSSTCPTATSVGVTEGVIAHQGEISVALQNGNLLVESKGMPAQVIVADVYGRQLRRLDNVVGKIEIDVSNVHGVFFVRGISKNLDCTKKFYQE